VLLFLAGFSDASAGVQVLPFASTSTSPKTVGESATVTGFDTGVHGAARRHLDRVLHAGPRTDQMVLEEPAEHLTAVALETLLERTRAPAPSASSVPKNRRLARSAHVDG